MRNKILISFLLIFLCTTILVYAQEEITLDNGLKYVDTTVGTGDLPRKGQTLIVNYIGKFLDGKIFDSSVERNEPFEFEFGTSNIIPGWNIGFATMKEGGKRKLIIPPELAYGKDGAGDVIPPNTTLVFEVELIKIKK